MGKYAWLSMGWFALGFSPGELHTNVIEFGEEFKVGDRGTQLSRGEAFQRTHTSPGITPTRHSEDIASLEGVTR